MADARLLDRLAGLTRRMRRERVYLGLGYGWILGGLLAFAMFALALPTWLAVAVGLLTALACGALAGPSRVTESRTAAQMVEQRHPELDARLLAAIDQQPQPRGSSYSYLQMRLFSDVLAHARQHDWSLAMPAGRLAAAQAFQLFTFLLFAAGAFWCIRQPAVTLANSADADPAAPAAAPLATVSNVLVEPGDVEVERGTPLLVTAQFGADLPAEVRLHSIDAQQTGGERVMVKSLSDPVFGARIEAVQADLVYRVIHDGQATRDYRVTTFEYPQVQQIDAMIQPPVYASLPERHEADVRRVSVVEGSTVTLELRLNKPISSGELRTADSRQTFPLEPIADDPSRMRVVLPARTSQSLTVHLLDAAGRANRDEAEFELLVLENLPPSIRLAFPARDVRVSPLQELTLEGTAEDDFGLTEYGVVYQTPDGEDQRQVLGTTQSAGRPTTMSHRLDLEPLAIEPNELVSFYFYADDIGPDGTPRRTYSDMFFAQVRPWEEIYRQGANSEQSQSEQQQQQQQQQNESGQLAELQRQIVTAAWNVARQHPIDPPAEGFAADAAVIAQSQQEVRGMAEQLAGEVDDPILQEHAAEALQQMQVAQAAFEQGRDGPSVEPIHAGRAAAQLAYRALLRMSAREHEVQRSQSQSQSQSQAQRTNRQLDELELKNDRHRYETERQAQQQQSEAARESLQVLNRLKELARRQEDLNERVRQLQNELRTEQDEERRAELELQLQRLQQDQEDLLRDVDELRERMNREENRSRMAEAREQLDETREQVRQSSESLQAGETSEALTEGTRAQRQLEQMEDQFRRETAGRFEEAISNLREQARELADNQQRIADELNGTTSPDDPTSGARRPPPTLRADEGQNREALTEQLQRQEEALQGLLTEMRTVVEESETAEPLLSSRLYEAIRDTRADKPLESLAAASQLYRRGFDVPAREAEAQARAGIDKLRDSIEQAANTILGDEEEALRRARDELRELSDSVGRELASNDRSSDPAGDRAPEDREPGGRTPGQGEESASAGSPTAGEGDPMSPASGGDGRAQAPEDGSADARSGDSERPGAATENGERPDGTSQRPGAGTPTPGQRPEEGAEPGRAPRPTGQRPGESPQPGESTAPTPGTQPGQSLDGEGEPSGQQPGGQQPGSQQPGGQQPGGERPGQGSPQRGQPGLPAEGGGGGRSAAEARDALSRLTQSLETSGGGNAGPVDPLTGGAFTEWSDRMRDIEEMLSDPQLKVDVAKIRERARELRIEFKRHSKAPDWELVRASIYGPMRELEAKIAEELARRGDGEDLVPSDRDPVPEEYADLVRRYYEELSRSP
ncbi:MAG: DUF4175 family protein [Planctomycetaceae bacterium]